MGAQASGQPTGGVVHVYEYDPPTNVPGRIILTGAISDHGVDRAGAAGPNHTYNKLVLTKGSFEINVGKIKIHQHLDTTSCTLVVQGSGPAPIVKGSGTGAYRGITGTFAITVTADEVQATPCTRTLRFLWQVVVLAGPGTVSI